LDITGIVLAGGTSRRFGRDKASEPLNGRPLLQWAEYRLEEAAQEIIVVKAAGQKLPAFEARKPLTVIEDLIPAKGPLGGIYSGLQAASHELSIAVACDMPLLCVPLLRRLCQLADGYDVVIPRREGRLQPLHAVYRRICAEPMRDEIQAGRFEVISFLHAVRVRYVNEDEWAPYDNEGLSFFNVNAEADLVQASQLLTHSALGTSPETMA
jgi:molybdopterin-guanine dinucleotide biosynthesis protein A